MKNYHAIIPFSLIKLGIICQNDHLISLDFLPSEIPAHTTPERFCNSIIAQINAYLETPNFSFTIPIKAEGTRFQHKVWQALRQIPVGQTKTYGSLAKELHTSPRAIGQACRTNPTPVVVPCHRIVGSNDMGGFSGKKNTDFLKLKSFLLAHEKVYMV